MMRNRNKWLAAVLILSLALGNCGGITALATETIVNSEDSLSENTIISDETPEDDVEETENSGDFSETSAGHTGSEDQDTPPDADAISETEKTAPETELPALHIGYIPEDGTLPTVDDNAFIYDLPVSFESSKRMILFVNYDIESLPESQTPGTLEWSILRGEKGMEPGSVTLHDEADDWNGFESVPSSPFFTMEKTADAENGYNRAMTLSPVETADDELYDYYIRAAYYPETEEGKAVDFYAASTIPFLPPNDTAKETDQISEDASDTEEFPADPTQQETSVSENSADDTDDTLSENTPANPDVPDTGEDIAGDTEETLSTLSENNTLTDVSTPFAGETPTQTAEMADVTSITLSETQTLTMQPEGEGSTKQITAAVILEPSDGASPPLLWESSVENVATVEPGENGTATIKAVAEGYTQITASCGGKTASVTVDVVPDTANPGDKLLDLSNEIRVAGFLKESDSLVYTGQKITQNIRVYYNENLLTEKTDYTLSYRNNINAAAWNTAKAPSVTINLKGQYQGSVTLYYTIKPLDINKIDIYGAGQSADGTKTPAYEQTVNYAKNMNLPAPVLYFGKKKLAAKKDFICDYAPLTEELAGKDYKKGDSYEAGTVYHYTVNGTGNFTGSFLMDLVVLKDDLKKKNFSTASVKLDKSKYDYCGKPLLKTDVKIESVKISGQTLDPSLNLYDYEVCANGIEGASLTVFPTEAGRTAGYRGCKKINLRLAGDRKISEAVFGSNWKNEITFSQQIVDKTGGMFQEKTDLLKFGSDTLVEGIDYTIKYGNAKKAGNVTVTFKGLGRYTGSVSKKYKILPNCDSRNLTIVWGKNVTKKGDGSLAITYQKNGAAPEFYIRDENYVVLNGKTDYTVRLKDNKKITEESEKQMLCTIKGKGNYNGYEETISLTVIKADIGKASITVSDKPYDPRANKWKSAVTVTDINGKKLAAGTDYVKDIVYTYEGMNPEDPAAVPTDGKIVTVKVTGTGFYEGTITTTYHIYDKANDIGKLKVKIDDQIYTGTEVTLDPKDIHFYKTNDDLKKQINELPKSCFEIKEYKNNIKAGTAKVTIHALDPYGGTKTYSFKILKKAYGINRVKGIRLDKPSFTVSMLELQDAENNENAEAGKLTATITSQTAETIANPTVIWSSSNSKIATVEDMHSNTSGMDDTTKTATATSTVRIKAKGAGTVTITAVTQDGNKRAQCRVTITNQPVLTEAGQTVKANVGETYELHLRYAQTDTPETATGEVKWESSNPEAVSVDNNGILTMNKAGVSVITVSISKYKFTAQCNAIAIDPNEEKPEGKVFTYEQKPGTTDDTAKINEFLRTWEHNPNSYDCLYIPAGIYHIDAAPSSSDFGGIILTDNQKLIMSPSALLIALGNNNSSSHVIWAFGRDNITISGGQIIGERHAHSGTGGEWGHGIQISGCTNVTIENVNVSQCWGDGIYLGLYDGWDKDGNKKKFFSDGVTITNCNLYHNRRNNLSITDASNITISDCRFNYAGRHNGQAGHDPQFGIDIEPNISGYVCRNVKISNSEFKGNTKASLGIITAADGITLENCSYDGPIYNKAGNNVTVNGKAFPRN